MEGKGLVYPGTPGRVLLLLVLMWMLRARNFHGLHYATGIDIQIRIYTTTLKSLDAHTILLVGLFVRISWLRCIVICIDIAQATSFDHTIAAGSIVTWLFQLEECLARCSSNAHKIKGSLDGLDSVLQRAAGP